MAQAFRKAKGFSRWPAGSSKWLSTQPWQGHRRAEVGSCVKACKTSTLLLALTEVENHWFWGEKLYYICYDAYSFILVHFKAPPWESGTAHAHRLKKVLCCRYCNLLLYCCSSDRAFQWLHRNPTPAGQIFPNLGMAATVHLHQEAALLCSHTAMCRHHAMATCHHAKEPSMCNTPLPWCSFAATSLQWLIHCGEQN